MINHYENVIICIVRYCTCSIGQSWDCYRHPGGSAGGQQVALPTSNLCKQDPENGGAWWCYHGNMINYDKSLDFSPADSETFSSQPYPVGSSQVGVRDQENKEVIRFMFHYPRHGFGYTAWWDLGSDGSAVSICRKVEKVWCSESWSLGMIFSVGIADINMHTYLLIAWVWECRTHVGRGPHSTMPHHAAETVKFRQSSNNRMPSHHT